MNKNILLYLVLSLLGSSLWAQHRRPGESVIQAYPTFGFTTSQISGDNLKGFRKFGFTGGVGTVIPLNSYQTFLLDVSTSFSQRGAHENSYSPGIQYLLTGFTLNYVDIPVMLYYRDPIGGIQAGLGLSFSRLVQQPHGEIAYSPSNVIPDTSDMSFLRNDLALVAGFRFSVWKHLKLDLRCQYSLLPIKRDWHFTDYHDPLHEPAVWEEYNDCYNFSIQTRVMYVFGEPDRYRTKKKKR